MGNLEDHICLAEENGKPSIPRWICSLEPCPINTFCSIHLDSSFKLNKFDSFSLSTLQVYTVMTLEGWSDVMERILLNYSQHMWVYFFSIIMIGNYWMVNLTLAILKVKFQEAQKSYETNDILKTQRIEYDLQELRSINIWKKNKRNTFTWFETSEKSEEVASVDIPAAEKTVALPPQPGNNQPLNNPVNFNRRNKVVISLSKLKSARSMRKSNLIVFRSEIQPKYLKSSVCFTKDYKSNSENNVIGQRYSIFFLINFFSLCFF